MFACLTLVAGGYGADIFTCETPSTSGLSEMELSERRPLSSGVCVSRCLLSGHANYRISMFGCFMNKDVARDTTHLGQRPIIRFIHGYTPRRRGRYLHGCTPPVHCTFRSEPAEVCAYPCTYRMWVSCMHLQGCVAEVPRLFMWGKFVTSCT